MDAPTLKCLGAVGDIRRQRERVYDISGIAPCINGVSCDGGYNNQPRVLIRYGDKIKF